jgi:DNA polymerase III sliding clamp (beta) subunit (PCNA family)
MLTVSAFAAEEAEISIELGASIVGPDAKVALNSRYIQDALATASETVTLEIDTPSTPVLFRSVVGRTVVMPMFCQW